MEQKKVYTITVFSENKMGMLGRIATIISRRHINIESLNASKSSIEGIHRFTISVILPSEEVRKLVAQINKQVDVLKAFYYNNSEIVYQEVALYKVPAKAFADGDVVENLIRSHNARILSIEPEYIVIEKTGHPTETEQLLEELKEIGLYEFVRSGRVAIVKPMERLNNYLKSLDQ
ncbi:MAG: acetolactate synthase small subunit [Saprospiraceae bacterium]